MRLRRPLLLTTALVITIAALLPKIVQSAARYYLPALQNQLEQQGVRLSVNNLSGHFLGLSASSVEMWIAVKTESRRVSMPVNVELQDVSISLEPSFTPRVRILASAYQGSIDLTAQGLLTTPTVSGQIQTLDLASHPQLHALGLARGLLSLKVEGLSLPFNPLSSSELDVELTEGSFAPSTQLIQLAGPEVQQIAELLKIQSVTDVRAKLAGSMERGAFVVRPIQLSSSLVRITGQARGTFEDARTEGSLTGALRLSLTEDSKHLTSWLPLLSQGAIAGDTSDFSVRISSTSCAGRPLQTLQLGRLCIRGQLTP